MLFAKFASASLLALGMMGSANTFTTSTFKLPESMFHNVSSLIPKYCDNSFNNTRCGGLTLRCIFKRIEECIDQLSSDRLCLSPYPSACGFWSIQKQQPVCNEDCRKELVELFSFALNFVPLDKYKIYRDALYKDDGPDYVTCYQILIAIFSQSSAKEEVYSKLLDCYFGTFVRSNLFSTQQSFIEFNYLTFFSYNSCNKIEAFTIKRYACPKPATVIALIVPSEFTDVRKVVCLSLDFIFKYLTLINPLVCPEVQRLIGIWFALRSKFLVELQKCELSKINAIYEEEIRLKLLALFIVNVAMPKPDSTPSLKLCYESVQTICTQKTTVFDFVVKIVQRSIVKTQ